MKVLSDFDMTQNQFRNVLLHVSTTPPENPIAGQLWFNSNTNWNILMFWDASRSAWLSVETLCYSYSRNANITASQYLRVGDGTTTDQAPHVVCRNCMVTQMFYNTSANASSTAALRTVNLQTQAASGNLLEIVLTSERSQGGFFSLPIAGPIGLAVYVTSSFGSWVNIPTAHVFVKYHWVL